MEIYIDFREVSEKAQFAQAIKVFAMTYKTDTIYVLIDKDKSTLREETNLKLIEYNENLKMPNLYSINYNQVNNSMLKLAFLKPAIKGGKNIVLGDLNKNNLSLEDKYNLLKKYNFIKKDYNYSLLTMSLDTNDELKEFDAAHANDEFYKGATIPADILNHNVSALLTSSDISNNFINSLYYAIEFLQLKTDDQQESSGIFNKLFSWNKGNENKIVINSLIQDYNMLINDEQTIFVAKDNMNYNYYFQTLNTYYSLIKK